ncbi:MAG TPA: class I SAM-dependent methyltransferase [Tepidisphaeraceae bacterium]|nr:class I SAM-dependent methyltransferase [Tepidisphaeraceae bacterium]
MAKLTVDQIRARFDASVERFSNLETGQTATMDAAVAMELVARAAAGVTPGARSILDVGCGAGNYTLKVIGELLSKAVDVTLVDLSGPMLDRAKERVSALTSGRVETVQADVRTIDLGEGRFDMILAAAVLHHLRTDDEWRAVFAAFHRALRPGGGVWVFDLVESPLPGVRAVMWERYGEYLVGFKGEAYRDEVFTYIEAEDTPRSVGFQMGVMREVGFGGIDVLHKNGPFAAFGGVKG